MGRIDLVLSEVVYQHGIQRYIQWNTESAPHMAISGITGTGKTYLVKLILARIGLHLEESMITLCDFKGDKDFSFLSESKRFYRFEDCVKGFQVFYDSFTERQRNHDTESFQMLVFDEWSSFLNYLDKKEADEMKKKLSTLLMLGRSYDYHVLLSQQRLDAESFGKSRDNFNVIITLGNPSKEVKEMLFSEYKDEIINDRTRGTGYMLTNGADFQKIVVPEISRMDKVNEYIKKTVNR